MSTTQRSENASFDDVCRFAVDYRRGRTRLRLLGGADRGILVPFDHGLRVQRRVSLDADGNGLRVPGRCETTAANTSRELAGHAGSTCPNWPRSASWWTPSRPKRFSVADATARLSAIDKTPTALGPCGERRQLFVLRSRAGCAVLSGVVGCSRCRGSWPAGLWDGVVVRSFRRALGRSGYRCRASFVVAALATTAKLWMPELNVVMVVLAAIAVLLPAYTDQRGHHRARQPARRLGHRESDERTGLSGQAVRRRVARRRDGGLLLPISARPPPRRWRLSGSGCSCR